MSKKIFSIILVALFALVLPLTAQSEGIPLQKDVLLGSPIFGPEDLPEEITFTLYDSQTAATPLGYQTFTRGQYTVDFEFSKSNGITAGNVARVSADFTKTLNLKDAEGESIQPKELWAGIELGGAEIGDRTKVSDETLVQLLLASDASISTYLTLAYTGDANPITTIYKDLPISSLSSDGSGSSLANYFRGVTAGASDGVISPNALTDTNNWYPNGNNIFYNHGYVGIGMTNPLATLHLFGAMRWGDVTHTGILSTGSAGLAIGSLSAHPLRLYAGGTEKIRMLNNGYTGIGTPSAARRLHVSGNDSNLSFRLERTGVGAGYVDMGGSSGGLRIDTSTTGEVVRILQNGNVGIGTTNPTYELAVDGTIRCKELIVDTGWSDFVFYDNYRLPTLREVEQHIQEKGHLPGIPTEAQVKENGVSVGEISSRLLQKIEELTLYVIHINKENESLKAQLSAIQKQLGKSSN